MIKSRTMRWARHVEHIERRGIHIRFGSESKEESDHSEDLEVSGKILLRRILKKQDAEV
jgi:hypothetical protein